MNILVTGGAGFIGSHITDEYIKRNHKVVVVDNLSTGSIENVNKKAVFYKADICKDNLGRLLEKHKIEVINHHSAQIDVRKSVEKPVFDLRVNLEATVKLLQASVKYNIKKFIYASTGGAIYGEQTQYPAGENHTANPLSPYGITKLASEKYLYYYKKIYNLNYVILRYGNVYGPRQNAKGEAGVVSIFLEKMLKNVQPVINGTGRQTRDFVFVKDVALANARALKFPESDVFNISSNTETTVIKLFDLINNYFGKKFKKVFGPPKIGEQYRSYLSNGKANKIFKWKPETNLNDGLKETYDYYYELILRKH